MRFAMSGVRDSAAIRLLVLADAVFFRICDILIAALQSLSPDRSLKASLRGEIRTVLSPQPGPTIEEQDLVSFRCNRTDVHFRQCAEKAKGASEQTDALSFNESCRISHDGTHGSNVVFWA